MLVLHWNVDFLALEMKIFSTISLVTKPVYFYRFCNKLARRSINSMDANKEEDSDTDVKDLYSGEEPGAASEHYLVADDADDDLSDVGELQSVPRKRSGTISRLKKEIKKQQKASQIEAVKAAEATCSSDDAGNSSNVSESESDYAVLPDTDTVSSQNVCFMLKYIILLKNLSHMFKLLRSHVETNIGADITPCFYFMFLGNHAISTLWVIF